MAKKTKTFCNETPPEFVTQAGLSDLACNPDQVRASFLRSLFHAGVQHTLPHAKTPYTCSWIPGRYFGDSVYGPERETDIMVVSPYAMELTSVYSNEAMAPMGSRSLQFFKDILSELQLDCSQWYLTSLIKGVLDESVGRVLPASWKHYCYPWLCEEVRRIKPKYIICIGSHVIKEIYGGSTTLEGSYERVLDYTFEFEDGTTHATKLIVIPAISDSNAESRDEVRPRIVKQMKLLRQDYMDIAPGVEKLRHIILTNGDAVKEEVSRVKALNQNIIAVDLEWEGRYPGAPGAHVLTFQFSTLPGEAAVCVLSTDEGASSYRQDILDELAALFIFSDNWEPRLGGHFLRADLPWVLDLYKERPEIQESIKRAYAPANTPELCRDHGGWDTSLMIHAWQEDRSSYGLKDLAELLLGVDKWDKDLADYLREYVKTHRMKKSDLTGFGCVPCDVLYPYAAWDADATRRLAELCLHGYGGKPALLDKDAYGNESWVPFWRAHSASLAFLEMEQEGFVLDVERLNALSLTFKEVYDDLLAEFRSKISWEDFNPQSTRHKQGFLFGRQFTKSDAKNAKEPYAMPEDAVSLHLDPLYCTGSKQNWEDLNVDETSQFMPASDSMTLAILSQENDLVRMLYDICKLGNTLKSNIRPPIIVQNEDGSTSLTYDAGIYTYRHENGRVYTHLVQLLKTGRLSSRDPNFQNISKSAEALIKELLGTEEEPSKYPEIVPAPRYLYPMRTILKAPEDRVLIESDFTGAELAVMAWMSGDENMIEHVRRNALPEDDPDFYDIHSNIAVTAFRLNCAPTKHGLASIGKKHLRVAAKAVVFG